MKLQGRRGDPLARVIFKFTDTAYSSQGRWSSELKLNEPTKNLDFEVRPVFRDLTENVYDGSYSQARVPEDLKSYGEVISRLSKIREVLSWLKEHDRSWVAGSESVHVDYEVGYGWHRYGLPICPQFTLPSGYCNCTFSVCPPYPSSLVECQRYRRRASQGGIGFSVVERLPGGDGTGSYVFDIEKGLGVHEDLVDVEVFKLGGPVYACTSTKKQDAHGTAVLGLLKASKLNNIGLRGVCTGSVARFIKICSIAQPNNLESTLVALGERSEESSIILIELQYRQVYNDAQCISPLLPVEHCPTIRNAIEMLVKRGRHVVLAAGNGNVNLNTLGLNVDGSGAIMVGAICPGCGQRVPSSNYGNRVDVVSWGRKVVTCGSNLEQYNTLVADPDARRCYTKSFGGTSSAAALTAGVVSCLVGLLALKHRSIKPADMRRSLKRQGGQGTPVDLEDSVVYLKRVGMLP